MAIDLRPADLALPCEHPFIGCPCRQPGDGAGPVMAKGTYQLGFLTWSQIDPALLGDPLEDERGGIPGFSVQRTSKGRLMACNLIGIGWRLTFWSDIDGSRWLFKGDRSEQIA